MIDVLEPGYGPLFDRVCEVFGADTRVRALWLGGSLARGTADGMSDLDLLVAVADDALDGFAAEWRTWLGTISPTVIARPLPFLPGSLYAVAPGRERLDVVVEAVSALPTTGFRQRVVVFDHDQLDGQVPAPEDGPGPAADRVAALIEEFFRDTGMFPVVVGRRDWLLGIEAVHLVRSLLYQLFVEANAPLAPMGVKQWSTKLTPEQRSVLEALPGASATEASVTAAHVAASRAFVTHARRIATELAVPWPDDLDQATRRYLHAHGLSSADEGSG